MEGVPLPPPLPSPFNFCIAYSHRLLWRMFSCIVWFDMLRWIGQSTPPCPWLQGVGGSSLCPPLHPPFTFHKIWGGQQVSSLHPHVNTALFVGSLSMMQTRCQKHIHTPNSLLCVCVWSVMCSSWCSSSTKQSASFTPPADPIIKPSD